MTSPPPTAPRGPHTVHHYLTDVPAAVVDGYVEEVQRLASSAPGYDEAAELESLRRSQRAETVSYGHQRRHEHTQPTSVGDLYRHV